MFQQVFGKLTSWPGLSLILLSVFVNNAGNLVSVEHFKVKRVKLQSPICILCVCSSTQSTSNPLDGKPVNREWKGKNSVAARLSASIGPVFFTWLVLCFAGPTYEKIASVVGSRNTPLKEGLRCYRLGPLIFNNCYTIMSPLAWLTTSSVSYHSGITLSLSWQGI